MLDIHYLCDHCNENADNKRFDVAYFDKLASQNKGDWHFCSWRCLRRFMRAAGLTENDTQ